MGLRVTYGVGRGQDLSVPGRKVLPRNGVWEVAEMVDVMNEAFGPAE
jgi:hypothetical protein